MSGGVGTGGPNGDLLNGDWIVALLGLVLALFLVSRHHAFRSLAARYRIVYAVAWAVIIGVVAALADGRGQ